MSGKVHPLHGNQMRAVEPDETVWLSASAGTGKTQVLSSRVLRLLLQRGVEPSQILCLTFTKAGATEMAARINERLARWVRLPATSLAEELQAIGAAIDPATQDRARTLFASVLDCPGGGLRIDTIHAFSQWLLGAFPLEAGLSPGTRAMEDRDRIVLLRQVLADLLVRAESEPLSDPSLSSALADLSLRMGPDAVEAYLLRCAESREAWFGPGAWQEPLRPRVLQLLGLPADADRSQLAGLCGDDVFDVASLRSCMEINAGWSAATGQHAAAAIAGWLAGDAEARGRGLDALAAVFLTKDGKPRSTRSQDKIDPEYATHCERVIACIAAVAETRALLDLAERLVPALRLGRAFALAWDEAKRREGFIDFDDQIRIAASLLSDADYAQWIGYKLDRRFDHILVDEAQDTNASQWRIIDALTQEFFAGLGQRGDVMRTLFVVGDYKQAIFRFQGTSPENFERAKQRVRDAMAGAKENAERQRSNYRARELRDYGLDRSFRTAQTVLDFVDAAIANIGADAFGLPEAPQKHEGEDRPGYVAIWRPVGAIDEEEEDEPEEGAQGWLSRPDRQMAERIARQVAQWMDPAGPGFPLVKGGKRRAGPGDVMVLVRKRRDLAGLVVARLHAAGVAVAGVDRLRLGAPLAVRDLVAALRFAAQPFDDLNLACLLGSPLVGWSQEQILEHCYRPKHTGLWSHLRRSSHPDVAAAMELLGALLRLADFEPPQALLHWLLVGPWQARRKLVARLGREANDPIDELLNAANSFAASHTPGLAAFLNWFDAGEGELKREAGSSDNLVRVMTVHGSKGLQAPIVILADATGNPDNSRTSDLSLPDPAAPDQRSIPLPGLRKEEIAGRLKDHAEQTALADREEHWRLLYVAMTRAEEALFIGGALGARENEPADDSWYARLRGLFPADDWRADPIFGGRLEWGEMPETVPSDDAAITGLPLPEPLPRWLTIVPPAEARPPRPLAPSALGEEEEAPDPPYPPGAGEDAARRGTTIHKLLERLPDIPDDLREEAGKRWLQRNAADFTEVDRAAMLDGALAVLRHPGWQELFSGESLAEVPFAATVGGSVVAGSIDRLLLAPDRIRVVDYKTSRRPPADIAAVPRSIMRQMAAYAAALESIYPGRTVDVALLYTSVPLLLPIPQDMLAEHKQALVGSE
ncbi:double-strand break repair helicase AddA [Novosphingobium marinum]|uniref:DNA 3'-5' helicase n=1 Tax=Novosphingobium marinum TaxID=1514948 RepID=A0A7Y9XU20_9SPHN|nr:double-strand break repair helicase AddA [Novosphingobium marinum]NYH94554.1 ATP-dependent helicase/nuclease subunit A [Novosphingobium marinum]GGC23220.1 double-strand break repair helicase AddA [Novosphingobium marinum]